MTRWCAGRLFLPDHRDNGRLGSGRGSVSRIALPSGGAYHPQEVRWTHLYS